MSKAGEGIGILDLVGGRSTGAPKAGSAGDFFDLAHYGDWIRATMDAAAAHGDAATLYDTTISEPTGQLVEIIREAFSLKVTDRYASVFVGGNRFLVDAIAQRYGVPRGQILSTTGVTSGLQMIFKALVKPGDHVLIETPGFDLLSWLARGAGAQVEALDRAAPDFKIDIAQLKAKLTPRTRLVVVTNLHNPSGAWLSPGEIQELAAAAAQVDAYLLIDEVYGDFARAAAAAPALNLARNIISLGSLTKVFGLFALKCGWIFAPPPVVAALLAASPEGDPGVSKLSHAVAAHVLEQAEVFDSHWKKILSKARPVMLRHAAAMFAEGLIEGAVPDFGCMYFPKLVGIGDTRAHASRLWRGFGVLVAPGEYFGLPGHVRLGFAGDPERLDRNLTRLHEALRSLRREQAA